MSDMLEEILKRNGPCLSTDLAQLLIVQEGLSPEAARKRVSRGCSGLKRLAYLPFPRKAKFLYLQKDYGSPWYWDALKKAIQNNSPAYGPAMAALIQRGGIMPRKHFLIACGAPLQQKKRLSAETLLDRLKLANVFDEVGVPGIGMCVALAEFTNDPDFDVSELKARLVTETILLKAVSMWARNLGLVSYNMVRLRDESNELPQIGTFAWDLTGPSYLAPMVDWSSTGRHAQGFIACDVMLGSEVTEKGLQPFLHKCLTLRALKKVGRCMQIFIATSYSKKAFSMGKESGIIPATPETLFGTEVAEGLSQLTAVLTHTAKASIKPEVFNELFQRLGKIEGAAVNLRGALFEFIAAELVRQTISSTIILNKIFRNEAGDKAEVDVLAVNNRKVYFIECKGYQPSGIVEDEEIERWLEKRIPLVRQQALKHPDWKSLKLHFELWTTGKLTDDAIARINAVKAKTTKYTIEYRDAAAVYAYAKNVDDRSLILTLRQHFFKHPITTVEEDVNKKAERAKRARQNYSSS